MERTMTETGIRNDMQPLDPCLIYAGILSALSSCFKNLQGLGQGPFGSRPPPVIRTV
jgi:hypothetical protein